MSARALVAIILIIVSAVLAYLGYSDKDTFQMLLALYFVGLAIALPPYIVIKA